MKRMDGPIIDMTPSGNFAREPISGPSLGVILARVLIFTVALGFAALAFWLAVFSVPVLIVAGLAAYGFLRFKMARNGMSFARPVTHYGRR